jgi:dipeptidyl aminopeptidase/acylaminoacyl peptidase
MSGVDAVIERGFIDTDNLFVTGGSGGGVLSAWIVGKTDRFAAAVVAKPVINWISTTLTTDISTFMPEYWFADMPWENPDAEQYYQALKLRKIDSALIRVPEASHGIAARPSHLIAKVDNILAWFERYKNDE